MISEEELIKLLSDFYGKEYTEVSEEEQQRLRQSYRKVELENTEEIKKAGGFENWYASGEGRLMSFDTSVEFSNYIVESHKEILDDILLMDRCYAWSKVLAVFTLVLYLALLLVVFLK